MTNLGNIKQKIMNISIIVTAFLAVSIGMAACSPNTQNKNSNSSNSAKQSGVKADLTKLDGKNKKEMLVTDLEWGKVGPQLKDRWIFNYNEDNPSDPCGVTKSFVTYDLISSHYLSNCPVLNNKVYSITLKSYQTYKR